jgi:hypothetical protein
MAKKCVKNIKIPGSLPSPARATFVKITLFTTTLAM